MKNLISLLLSITLLFISSAPLSAAEEVAIFAGGCFWCLEHDLEVIDGVISAESGYSGGTLSKPTYQSHDGHQESVLIHFDNNKITYNQLLINYLRNIDPFDGNGQFCDRGDSYRPMIFSIDEKQKKSANKAIEEISDRFSVPLNQIKIEIKDATKFWLAEEYHQDYASKNQIKYMFYRNACGRDKRLRDVWEKAKLKY